MQDVLQPWKLYVNTKPQPSSDVLIFHKGGGDMFEPAGGLINQSKQSAVILFQTSSSLRATVCALKSC